MASIWTDIEIEWKDKRYTLRPNLEVINHLERKPGRSLAKMLTRVTQADLPSAAACELIADVLELAGAKGVTAEDVFLETSGGVDATAVDIAATILIACLPAPKDTGVPVATGKKKGPVTRTGRRSTASR